MISSCRAMLLATTHSCQPRTTRLRRLYQGLYHSVSSPSIASNRSCRAILVVSFTVTCPHESSRAQYAWDVPHRIPEQPEAQHEPQAVEAAGQQRCEPQFHRHLSQYRALTSNGFTHVCLPHLRQAISTSSLFPKVFFSSEYLTSCIAHHLRVIHRALSAQ
jgi:hypothetical protein